MHRPRFASISGFRRLLVPLILLALIISTVTVKQINTPLNQGLDNLRQGRCAQHSTVPVLCSASIPLLFGKADQASPGEKTPHNVYIGDLQAFQRAHPDLIGDPVTNEHPFRSQPGEPTYFEVQQTTKGLLLFDRILHRSYFVPDGAALYEFDHGHMLVFKDGKTQTVP
jgi:hypothetical protein